MKKILFIMLLSLVTITMFGQDFEVPKDYKFAVKEDYKPYEPQILKAIDWLLNTPINVEVEKRKDVNAFVLTWLMGSPDVTINLNLDIVHISKTNEELLFPFIAGWTVFSINNDYSKDNLLGTKAGIEAAVNFYEKNKKVLKKDKEIEKFKNLIEKDKLHEELQKKFK